MSVLKIKASMASIAWFNVIHASIDQIFTRLLGNAIYAMHDVILLYTGGKIEDVSSSNTI